MKENTQGELSVHRDFNPSTASTTTKIVQDIKEYLLKVNPYKTK